MFKQAAPFGSNDATMPDTAGAFGPLTLTVQVPGPRTVTVSAFCPKCGIRRRPYGPAPAIGLTWTTRVGRPVVFLSWMNPCGHVDTAEGLIAEESQQCAAPGCVLLWSVENYPYCSSGCAARILAAR